MNRVRAQGDFRPMGDDRSAKAELRAILHGRGPLYARAQAAVDTSGRTVAESAAELMRVIARAPVEV
jgi:XRE family transcriptional regulator, aerobic/anaerobic benzoate catabolism transcriptional regulator